MSIIHYPNNYLLGQLLREDYPNGIQTVNQTDIKFSDVFCAAFNSLSGLYKYVFGFTGGYKKELCGNYKVYCIINGNIASGQKCIVKETINVKDVHYNHLLGWYILESKHPMFKPVPLPRLEQVQLQSPPERPHLIYTPCPQPTLIDGGKDPQYIGKCKCPQSLKMKRGDWQ